MKTFLLTGFAVFLGSIAAFLVYHPEIPTNSKQGSISSDASGYNDLTYNSTNSSQGSTNEIKTKAGIFGSAVITVTGAGSFTLYDATTSNVLNRANIATSSLKMIASFGPSQAAGTYTYDVAFGLGLVRDPNGAQGTTTITIK